MKKIAALLALLFLLPVAASAQSLPTDTLILVPLNSAVVVSCTGLLTGTQIDGKNMRLTCVPESSTPPPATATPPPAPTAAATPSPTPHSMADMTWHAPGKHGDRPAHEHGDAPPRWVTDAGYKAEFSHVAGTPNENHAYYKHTAFKGWAGRFNNQDWYGIFHMDFNPGGHQSRFHSYQLWIKDSTGAVSHMHGWVDFGEDLNTGPNLVITCGVDSQIRPIIKPNQVGCPVQFENWYANAANPGPDLGWNLNPNYFAGGDPTDPSTWVATGGIRNLTRRFEFAWYGFWGDERRTGDFYTTQFGNVVNGPTDPACGTPVAIGARTYTIVCLKQTVQPTLKNVQFPGNAIQRTFPGTGVTLPN